MAIFSRRRLVRKTVTRLPPASYTTADHGYWIFSRKTRTNLPSYTMTAVVDFFYLFIFLSPPVPVEYRGNTVLYTHTGCRCCSGVIYKFATRRHFNAAQSPFNKPINELLFWHAEMTRSMEYVKVLPKKIYNIIYKNLPPSCQVAARRSLYNVFIYMYYIILTLGR